MASAGELIRKLRKEKGLTQVQLAGMLHVSDKAVSKWERGAGLPDITLLQSVAKIFEVGIEEILSGELKQNEGANGNMKRVKFYICPTCSNLLTSSTGAQMTCCSRKLTPLTAVPADKEHTPEIEQIENDYFLTFNHEMTKSHYLSFFAFVTSDKLFLIKLYPEQSSEVRFPRIGRGKMYVYCNEHGLLSIDN